MFGAVRTCCTAPGPAWDWVDLDVTWSYCWHDTGPGQLSHSLLTQLDQSTFWSSVRSCEECLTLTIMDTLSHLTIVCPELPSDCLSGEGVAPSFCPSLVTGYMFSLSVRSQVFQTRWDVVTRQRSASDCPHTPCPLSHSVQVYTAVQHVPTVRSDVTSPVHQIQIRENIFWNIHHHLWSYNHEVKPSTDLQRLEVRQELCWSQFSQIYLFRQQQALTNTHHYPTIAYPKIMPFGLKIFQFWHHNIVLLPLLLLSYCSQINYPFPRLTFGMIQFVTLSPDKNCIRNTNTFPTSERVVHLCQLTRFYMLKILCWGKCLVSCFRAQYNIEAGVYCSWWQHILTLYNPQAQAPTHQTRTESRDGSGRLVNSWYYVRMEVWWGFPSYG